MSDAEQTATNSPFHRGEIALQERAGVRERMADFGPRVIRDFMPDQHREFYAQLPMVILGHVDDSGRPWCSLVAGKPGFAHSPDRRQLILETGFLPGDPIVNNLKAGSQFGMLGIEFHSRRRNRMNGTVTALENRRLTLSVDQAFGNCPQYIQTRSFEIAPPASGHDSRAHRFDHLPDNVMSLIENADTFFVSSRAPVEHNRRVDGVDASHRGGQRGFVRVDDKLTLTIPDYSGNSHFNTLGNFLVDPRAGLLFVDFESGDIIMLTGTVDLIWDSIEAAAFEGAERLWRFRLDEGWRLPQASPLRWSFGEFSPASLSTGTWAETQATLDAKALRLAWRDYRATRIDDESQSIRSLYLEPADGSAPLPHKAGQFLTVRVSPDSQALIRTYTLSSAPGEPAYRISVKREEGAGAAHPGGAVSQYLHGQIKVGDLISARAPQGDFVWQTPPGRPAVLISAGVGITPMVSMLRNLVQEETAAQERRPVTFIHASRSEPQRAFFEEIGQLVAQSRTAIRPLWVLSQPGPGSRLGQDFDVKGRLTPEALQAVLPLDDYDIYLCGPGGFMQALYDQLRNLGVRDCRIFAEAFGPAALLRAPDQPSEINPVLPEAGKAEVTFVDSRLQVTWEPESGTLLELAEAQELKPEFGCRNGACGSCVTRVLEGEVTYRVPPRASLQADEILLCCAVPAQSQDLPPKLKLKL